MWCERGDSFFTPPFRLRNLLKTGCAKTAKNGKTACRGHNLGTVLWGEPLLRQSSIGTLASEN